MDLEKAVDRPLAEVVGAEHYAARREHLHAALGGRRVEFEVVSQTLSGPRNLQTVYIPDLRADGTTRGIFTLATDVTALKTVESELQRLARIDTLTGLANRRQFDEIPEQSLAVATKLLQAIREPIVVGDVALDVTSSMGLAWLDGTDEVDAKALMVRADRALYRAKDGGRDALVVFES
jgi:PleD family two-component response regulator